MPRDRKTLAAIAILAIGLAGTIVDPNGVIGVVLFGAAAAALLFLLARPLAGGLRLPTPTPTRVPMLVRWRTIAVVALGTAARWLRSAI